MFIKFQIQAMNYQNHFSGMLKKETISIYIKLFNLLNSFKIKNLNSQKSVSQGHLASLLHPELEIVYPWISDLQAADNCNHSCGGRASHCDRGGATITVTEVG